MIYPLLACFLTALYNKRPVRTRGGDIAVLYKTVVQQIEGCRGNRNVSEALAKGSPAKGSWLGEAETEGSAAQKHCCYLYHTPVAAPQPDPSVACGDSSPCQGSLPVYVSSAFLWNSATTSNFLVFLPDEILSSPPSIAQNLPFIKNPLPGGDGRGILYATGR